MKNTKGFNWIEYDFNNREKIPQYWYNKSSDLYASAGVLWLTVNTDFGLQVKRELKFGDGFEFSIACWPTYKMLLGLAFEALIKAKLLDNKINVKYTHSLTSLTELLKIKLSKIENDTLILLSHYTIWNGKYPLTKKIKDFEEYYKIQNELNNSDIFDWDTIKILWLKINNK